MPVQLGVVLVLGVLSLMIFSCACANAAGLLRGAGWQGRVPVVVALQGVVLGILRRLTVVSYCTARASSRSWSASAIDGSCRSPQAYGRQRAAGHGLLLGGPGHGLAGRDDREQMLIFTTDGARETKLSRTGRCSRRICCAPCCASA
jgi:hypothetical protein